MAARATKATLGRPWSTPPPRASISMSSITLTTQDRMAIHSFRPCGTQLSSSREGEIDITIFFFPIFLQSPQFSCNFSAIFQQFFSLYAIFLHEPEKERKMNSGHSSNFSKGLPGAFLCYFMSNLRKFAKFYKC